jgi:glycerol transport system ATP-binding protein
VVNDPPINLLAAEITQSGLVLDHLGAQSAGTTGRALPPGRYTLGLRAEDIRSGGPLPARVALTEVSGSETVTHLMAGAQPLVMLERAVTDHRLGSELGLMLDLGKALVFGADGALIPKGASHG